MQEMLIKKANTARKSSYSVCVLLSIECFTEHLCLLDATKSLVVFLGCEGRCPIRWDKTIEEFIYCCCPVLDWQLIGRCLLIRMSMLLPLSRLVNQQPKITVCQMLTDCFLCFLILLLVIVVWQFLQLYWEFVMCGSLLVGRQSSTRFLFSFRIIDYPLERKELKS